MLLQLYIYIYIYIYIYMYLYNMYVGIKGHIDLALGEAR